MVGSAFGTGYDLLYIFVKLKSGRKISATMLNACVHIIPVYKFIICLKIEGMKI